VKWLFKWLLRLVLVLVALLMLLLVCKDSLLRLVAQQRIRSQTGMDVEIGKFSSGIFSPVVTIENLKLYNTAEFGGTLFLAVPEIHFELDPGDLVHHRIHVTLMRFNLAELDVVRNEMGQTNFVGILNQARTKTTGRSDLRKVLQGFQFTGIDVLNLTFGKAKFTDLKDARNNREISVNLQDQIFKNVKSKQDLSGILFMIWLRSGGNFSFAPTKLTSISAAKP